MQAGVPRLLQRRQRTSAEYSGNDTGPNLGNTDRDSVIWRPTVLLNESATFWLVAKLIVVVRSPL